MLRKKPVWNATRAAGRTAAAGVVVAMAPVPLREIDAGVPFAGARQPQAVRERRASLFRFLPTKRRRRRQQQQQQQTPFLDGNEGGGLKAMRWLWQGRPLRAAVVVVGTAMR